MKRRRSSIFIFQAEAGIRDRNVTGVQTCALPIWRRDGELLAVMQSCGGVHHHGAGIHLTDKPHRRGVVTGDDRGGVARTITGDVLQCLRSEERRGGEGGGGGWGEGGGRGDVGGRW